MKCVFLVFLIKCRVKGVMIGCGVVILVVSVMFVGLVWFSVSFRLCFLVGLLVMVCIVIVFGVIEILVWCVSFVVLIVKL